MKHTEKVLIYLVLVVLGVLPLSGCVGPRTLPLSKTYPVNGRVLKQGEPVRYAMLHLDPLDGGGAEADAMTGEDGTFELRTFANDGRNDGGVPGHYRVTLANYDPNSAVARRLPKGARPTPISQEDTGVTVQIREGDNDLTIVVP
jgi:hypothetical protein